MNIQPFAFFFSALFLLIGHSGQAQFTLPGNSLPSIDLPGTDLPGIQLGYMPTGTSCIGSGCSNVLPVTLLQLQGSRLNNEQVQLEWKTQNETNSKGFDIERSLGDAINFLVVGNTATSTSTAVEKNYSRQDYNGYPGTSFYRVKQLDIDGRYTYSNIVPITGYNQTEKLQFFPNPVTTNTVAFCNSLGSGTGILAIFSAHGQKILQYNWFLSVGNNSLKVPLYGLSTGIYFVQLAWPNGHLSTAKLIVE